MDRRLSLMCGTDYPVPECQIIIRQPKIKEIALIGESDFFSGVQCLCLNKTMFVQDESDLSNVNNFQIFMTIMSEKEAADKKLQYSKFVLYFFQKVNYYLLQDQ